MIIAQRFHDDLSFHESIVGYFWSVWEGLDSLTTSCSIDIASNVYGFCYMFLAALLIDAWLIHATLEAEIPTAAHEFLWLEEDPISNSLDDLDFLCYNRMV